MNQYLDFAKKIAFEAGTVLEQYRHSFKIEKIKDDLNLDIATNADYAVEKMLIDAIHAAYPTHGILAEESGISLPKAEYVWIIDPLDGTKEYIRNSPYYYTLLSLERNGESVCAVGYQPTIKRMFSGSISDGAFVNNQKIHPSFQSDFSKSFIHAGLPNKLMPQNEVAIFLRCIQDLVYSAYRLRSIQWNVEGLFNTAMGSVEAYILPPSASKVGRPKWWDISSGLQMVEFAGGKITDFQGNLIQFQDYSKGIVASNGLIHTSLLTILRKYYPVN